VKLLLLSNSTGPSGFLVDALDPISRLAAGAGQAVFVPYAGITRDWDAFTDMVKAALAPLSLRIDPLHRAADPVRAVRDASLVIVGGGNTFHLLHHCRRLGLLDAIRARVFAGAPYLGWSAGANLACPTICTTNDMPVIDPQGLDALRLVPFQINPHYTDALPAGVRGESRNQRLAEFTRLQPDVPVLGLPEGNWLEVTDKDFMLCGPHPSWWFTGAAAPRELQAGALPMRA
jgi:dipeptidase E